MPILIEFPVFFAGVAAAPRIRARGEIADRSAGCAEKFPAVHPITVLLYEIPSAPEGSVCVPIKPCAAPPSKEL